MKLGVRLAILRFGLGGELLAEYAPSAAPTTPQKEYGYRNGQLLITAAGGSGGSGSQNVTWTNVVGVSTSGNSLTKSIGDGWNAGAVSTQTINSGDGYLEFTASETNKYRRAGVSQGDTSQSWEDIDFCLYLSADGSVYINEGTNARGNFGSYATGDVFRVAVEGGVVKYRKNGTLLYTSTIAPTYPLLVDTALYSNGSTLTNVVLSGSAATADINWLVADQLGTPRMVFDLTGSLAGVKRHDYLPFGEELPTVAGARTTTMGYSAADGVRQKFTSKERDNETGLDYFLARYYSSTQGRFTSPDEFRGGPDELYVLGTGDETKQALPYAEITNPQSINKYQYAYNNPLRFVDPDGHQGQQKKGVVETLLEYFGRIWKGRNPQDGMLPGSGNGEIQKPEYDGPLGDPNRILVNDLKEMGQRGDAYAETLAAIDPSGVSDFSLGWMKGDKTRVLTALGGAVLHFPGGSVTMREAKSLVGAFGKGTFETVSKSIKYHFAEHGAEVGAKNVVQYMRQATAFARNLRGAQRTPLEGGATRYVKNGYYVIKNKAGDILSYGRVN